MTTIKVNDLFSLEVTKEDTYGYVGLFSKKQNVMYSGYLSTFMLLNTEIEDVVHSLILCFKNHYNEDTLNIVEQKSILLLRDFYINE